jgi:hypothetical protein
MLNRSFAVAAFYQRHPHQLQAAPSVIQHSARDATFVPDQKSRKPNSSVMRRAQQMAVQPMPGVKVRPTDKLYVK